MFPIPPPTPSPSPYLPLWRCWRRMCPPVVLTVSIPPSRCASNDTVQITQRPASGHARHARASNPYSGLTARVCHSAAHRKSFRGRAQSRAGLLVSRLRANDVGDKPRPNRGGLSAFIGTRLTLSRCHAVTLSRSHPHAPPVLDRS